MKPYALAAALVAACSIGLLLYHQPAPAVAAADAARQKWEYKVVVFVTLEQEKELNKPGDEGWELVAVVGETCYFKRPK